jgi:poly(3-hydroxybutyrate) depolymerase
MVKYRGLLLLVPFCVVAAASCGGGGGGDRTGSAGSSGAAGSTGAAGTSPTGTGTAGTAGTGTGTAGDTGTGTGSAGTTGTGTGTAGTTGTGTGTAGTTGTGTGTAGTTGTGTGTAGDTGTGTGTAGDTGTGTGTAGTTGTAGVTGAGGSNVPKQTGMSAGCSTPPGTNDSSTKFDVRVVKIAGLNAVYLAGGAIYVSNGIAKEEPYNYTNRPYGLKLPKNYDPTKAYPVTIGGGGCGGQAAGYAGGGGLQIDSTGSTIEIGLQMLNGCFDDGGPAINNRADTPEEPYFRAVIADVEKNYCVDKSRIFVSGYSSGGWESYTLGCAAADLIRGISADEGGMRNVRPPCQGPVAAVLVAGTADTENPIGPLNPAVAADQSAIGRLGSYGSAPGRDDLLARNGCMGNAATATGQFDTTYTQCVKYTGCPEAYPVIWCALPGVGHNDSSYGGVNYASGGGLMWKVLGSLPAP